MLLLQIAGVGEGGEASRPDRELAARSPSLTVCDRQCGTRARISGANRSESGYHSAVRLQSPLST
jgi:hypothetical protein